MWSTPSARMIAGLFIVSWTFAVAAQEQSFVAFEANDWAVHESTGRVFASSTTAGEVVEFDRDGEVRRFQVGATPTELLIKQDRLIVACTKSPSLTVIDLKNNKVGGKVTLNGSGPYALFCSQAADNYVYCIANTGSAWWDGEVFQVNLDTLSVRRQTKIQPWGQSHALHVAMSRDGKWIVPDARGASSPSGADLMHVDAEELVFRQVRDYHDSFGQMVAGPFNRYWTFGNALYTLDITKRVRTFRGSPVAIHPRLDLAASLAEDSLALERFSDAKSFGTVKLKLPDSKPKNSRQRNARPTRSRHRFDPTIAFDVKNDSVFVGLGASGHWVELDSYLEGLDPVHVILVPSETQVLVGQTLRIPISLTNSDALTDTQITIGSGPQLARIEDNEFVWTPRPEDVGYFEIELVANNGKERAAIDTAHLTVRVVLPSVELGFEAASMSLSPDGKMLAIWGPTPGNPQRHSMQAGPDEIAVVDTTTNRVVVRKTLSQGIRTVLTDDRYVLLAPHSGNLFYRFDHRLEKAERQFLQSTPQGMFKLSPKRVAIVGNQVEVFDVTQMRPVKEPGVDRRLSSRPQDSLTQIASDRIRVANRVVRPSTGDLLRLTPGTSLPSLGQHGNQFRRAGATNGFEMWGRRLMGGMLTNDQNSRIAVIGDVQHGSLSERWPLAVFVGTQSVGRQIERRLKICDLIDGTVKYSSVINVSQNSPQNPVRQIPYMSGGQPLLVRGKRIYVLDGEELLVATIPQSIAKEMPIPAHFGAAQPYHVDISSGEPLTLNVIGSQSGTTYTLRTEYPGVKLDSETAELEIDGSAVWNHFLDKQQELSRRGAKPPDANSVFDSAENAARYRELLGEQLASGQFAFELPLEAVLRDQDGQQDNIELAVVVTAPREKLDRWIAERARQREKAANAVAAQQKAQRQQSENAQTSPESRPSTDERLDALESRMRRIEAALDSILRQLEKS